jgi:hypothetical protein
MKSLFPHRFKALYAVALITTMFSCKPSPPGIYKNGQISSWKQSDFHKMTKEALTDMKSNNMKIVNAVLAQNLIGDVNTEHQVEVISNNLTDNDYQLFDEYYVVSRDTNKGEVKPTGNDINRYGFTYPAGPSRERYFAFFLPKKSDNKFLISLVYTKLNYGWRITELDVEPYTIDGKTGPELLALGKKEYTENYLIAAINTLSLAATSFAPADFWVYPNRDSLETLSAALIDKANAKYKYPLTLSGVSSAPQLIRVYSIRNDKGTFPAVYYRTHYNIADTNAVKKENLEIQKYLGKVMPGFDKDVKYVLYSAYNKFPSSYESVDHFDMTEVVGK